MDINIWGNNDWKFIHPSETNPSANVIDPVFRQQQRVDYDSPHAICLPNQDNIHNAKNLHVFLCGTGCHPITQTCSYYLNTSVAQGYPTIALSYQWANYTDMEKNMHAMNEPDSQAFLCSYHHDCLFGGQSKITHVAIDQSIIHRLVDLISYLIHNSQSVEEKSLWSSYLSDDMKLIYHHMIFTGHSQGSGHVAYLAKHYTLARAILLSGPQEYVYHIDSSSCSWLDGDFATRDIRCLRHRDEEGTAALIEENWRHINTLYHARLLEIKAYDSTSHIIVGEEKTWDEMSSGDKPSHLQIRIDIDPSCDETRIHDDYVLFISHLAPRNFALSARPCHNSTVVDHITPLVHVHRPSSEDHDHINVNAINHVQVDIADKAAYSVTAWKWLLR